MSKPPFKGKHSVKYILPVLIYQAIFHQNLQDSLLEIPMFFEIFGKSCNRLDFYRKFQDIPDYAGKSWMVFDALQL